MTIKRFITGFIVAFVLFVLGDGLWHNWALYDFYAARLLDINGGAMGADFPPFIIAFEAIAAAGTTYIVLALARSVQSGAAHGALLGLMMVSAINFVSHSLIPKWDITMLMVDTAWGVALGAITGAAIVMAAGKKA